MVNKKLTNTWHTPLITLIFDTEGNYDDPDSCTLIWLKALLLPCRFSASSSAG